MKTKTLILVISLILVLTTLSFSFQITGEQRYQELSDLMDRIDRIQEKEYQIIQAEWKIAIGDGLEDMNGLIKFDKRTGETWMFWMVIKDSKPTLEWLPIEQAEPEDK